MVRVTSNAKSELSLCVGISGEKCSESYTCVRDVFIYTALVVPIPYLVGCGGLYGVLHWWQVSSPVMSAVILPYCVWVTSLSPVVGKGWEVRALPCPRGEWMLVSLLRVGSSSHLMQHTCRLAT